MNDPIKKQTIKKTHTSLWTTYYFAPGRREGGAEGLRGITWYTGGREDQLSLTEPKVETIEN